MWYFAFDYHIIFVIVYVPGFALLIYTRKQHTMVKVYVHFGFQIATICCTDGDADTKIDFNNVQPFNAFLLPVMM